MPQGFAAERRRFQGTTTRPAARRRQRRAGSTDSCVATWRTAGEMAPSLAVSNCVRFKFGSSQNGSRKAKLIACRGKRGSRLSAGEITDFTSAGQVEVGPGLGFRRRRKFRGPLPGILAWEGTGGSIGSLDRCRISAPFGAMSGCPIIETLDFLWSELAEFAGPEAAELQRTDGGSCEASHMVAELGKHAADLAIHALVEGEFEKGVGGAASEDADPAWGSSALGEMDAGHELLEVFGRDAAGDVGLVSLGDAVAGMSELRGEVAVVGQDEEALGVGIEASDGVDALVNAGEEVEDGEAAVGVGRGGEVAEGLIEKEVGDAFGLDASAVDADVIASQGGLVADSDDAAIDGDASLGNEALTGTAAAVAGVGEDFMKAFFHESGASSVFGFRAIPGQLVGVLPGSYYTAGVRRGIAHSSEAGDSAEHLTGGRQVSMK